jgi:Zn-dependent protease
MSEDEGVPAFERVRDAVPSFDFDAVRQIIEKEFRIYDTDRDVRGMPHAEIAAFYVMADKETFDRKFDAVRDAIRTIDPSLIVILQHRLGEDVILVARRPPVHHGSGRLNVFLLVATLVTTTLAGSLFWVGYKKIEGALFLFGYDFSFLSLEPLSWGMLTFAVPLMLILGVHELGHWWIARKHNVHTSLPYFIPVPPPLLFGTFGAFISMKEPVPDRKALFDIGAAGPIAGFIVTIPVLVLGMVLTGIVAEELPARPEMHASLAAPGGATWGFDANETVWVTAWEESATGTNEWVETIALSADAEGFQSGTGWRLLLHPVYLEADATVAFNVTYQVANEAGATANRTLTGHLNVTTAMAGATRDVSFAVPDNATGITATMRWEPPSSGLVSLGDSLLFLGVGWVVDQVTDQPEDVFIHPTALAGWVGLLVTGFNLLPAGQLDGGHVARALLGENMRWASYASILLMFALSFVFAGWLILAVLVLLLGVRHPPPLNDRTMLDDKRRVLGALVAIILIVSFVPIPLQAIP